MPPTPRLPLLPRAPLRPNSPTSACSRPGRVSGAAVGPGQGACAVCAAGEECHKSAPPLGCACPWYTTSNCTPEQPPLRRLPVSQLPAGAEGCRRLAARLLPRYARHFPQHADTAADTLIALAKLSLSGACMQGVLVLLCVIHIGDAVPTCTPCIVTCTKNYLLVLSGRWLRALPPVLHAPAHHPCLPHSSLPLQSRSSRWRHAVMQPPACQKWLRLRRKRRARAGSRPPSSLLHSASSKCLAAACQSGIVTSACMLAESGSAVDGGCRGSALSCTAHTTAHKDCRCPCVIAPLPLPATLLPRRQLAALLSASAASTANGGSHLLPNGGTGSGSASGAGSTAADAASAFESHLWPCLDRCFASHFRWAAARGGTQWQRG